MSIKIELKDHEVAQMVNELRDTAIKYCSAQQLRERLKDVIYLYAEEDTRWKKIK
jgi:hypothetical protein